MPRIRILLKCRELFAGWEMDDAVEGNYLDQGRITFLHEPGHSIGLREEDLFDCGVE